MRKMFFTLLMAVSCLAVSACPDANHPHMIDLGLPSGTKWACCNVGATLPEAYGDYYAWAETRTKSVYDWETYKYGYYVYGDYSIHLEYFSIDIAGKKYDAATANWGAPWRMPSLAQIRELLDNTTSVWITQNGVKGWTFTGSNGATVFFPAAGRRWADELIGAGTYGYYWSSTRPERDEVATYELYCQSTNADMHESHHRAGGQPVRPVCK